MLSPSFPVYEAYNPATAQVGAEHVVVTAAFDVMTNGVAAAPAIDKAFKRLDDTYAKYPIVQS